MTKRPLLVHGMHGMGDCIHQRAILRQIMRTRQVWLETSWPSIYHDLVGDDLHLIRRQVALRTQTKNAMREKDLFEPTSRGAGMESLRVMYHGSHVMQTESKTVLEAMCHATKTSYEEADYRLPVPSDWTARAMRRLEDAGYDDSKRILVYRPLVARPEWRGSMARNANVLDYAVLTAHLRSHFFVVSVADLYPGHEWIVGPQLRADLTLHGGELVFEELAGLFKMADCVLTSSGFAAILAPAVGTACINVVGGYEDARTHDSGARFAPFISIEPQKPCRCWTSQCQQQCTKEIDMLPALDKLAAFCSSNFGLDIIPRAGTLADMFEPEVEQAQGRPPLASPFARPLLPNQGLKA